jgi:hypothetical protein
MESAVAPWVYRPFRAQIISVDLLSLLTLDAVLTTCLLRLTRRRTMKRLSDPADLLNITCISLQQSTSSGACARLNSVTPVFDGSGVDSESAFSLDGMLCISVERSPTAEQRLNQLGRHFQSSIWSYSDETSQSHTQATCQQT